MSEPINLMVIDLSHYDDQVDYPTLKAHGIVGVIYKATEGISWGDPTYHSSRRVALAAGLLWGSYHFGTNDDVEQQVNNYLNYANPLSNELICLDFEDNGKSTMTVAQAGEWITNVEFKIDRTNHCVFYSGNLIKESSIIGASQQLWAGRRLWLAQYGDTPRAPFPWTDYWLWQYTDGSVGPHPHTIAGASSRGVDCNSYQGTPGQLAAEWATGLAMAPKPIPSGKSLGQINYEGYCAKSGGKSLISGAALPTWENQAAAIQEAWEAGAQSVAVVLKGA